MSSSQTLLLRLFFPDFSPAFKTAGPMPCAQPAIHPLSRFHRLSLFLAAAALTLPSTARSSTDSETYQLEHCAGEPPPLPALPVSLPACVVTLLTCGRGRRTQNIGPSLSTVPTPHVNSPSEVAFFDALQPSPIPALQILWLQQSLGGFAILLVVSLRAILSAIILS